MLASLHVLALQDALTDDQALWQHLETSDELCLVRAGSRAEVEALLAAGACQAILATLDTQICPWAELLVAANDCAQPIPLALLARPDAAEQSVEALRRGAAEVIVMTPGFHERVPGVLKAIVARQRTMVEQHHARRQLVHHTRRLAVLAEITAAFAEVSLDYTSALDTVAQHIAQAVDGMCAVLLLSEDRQWLNAVAVRHTNQRVEQLAHGLVRLLRIPTTGAIGQHAIDRGQALTIEQLDASLFPASLMSAFGMYEDLTGPSSLLLAPLRAQGLILGVAAILRVRGSGLDDELEFLQELANRAAITIAAAREHQAAQQELAARSQAEEALRRREQLFRALVENSRDGIFRLDTQLHMVYANPTTLAVLERSAENVIGRHCTALGLTADIAEQFSAAATYVLASHQEAIYTAEVHDEQEVFCYHVRLHPEFAPDGSIESILGIFRDITPLHKSQAQVAQLNHTLELRVRDRTAALETAYEDLRSAARLQRATFETTSYAIVVTGPDGIIRTLNPAAERMFGYSANEVVGHQSPVIWHDARELHERERLLADPVDGSPQVAAMADSTEGEWTLVRKDGTRFLGLVLSTAMLDEERQLTGYLTIVRDITERKQTEEALRASEARLQFLLAHTPAIIFTIRVDGDPALTFISDSVYNLLGYHSAEFTSTPQFWRDHVHPDDQAQLVEDSAQLLHTAIHTKEYRFLHADGSYRWVQTGSLLVRDQRGGPAEIVGYVVDVNARKDAEDALRRANTELSMANAELARTARLKDEFLASMSHELRTPLNAILGRAETLLEQLHGPLNERQLRSTRSIEESGRLLLALINDILDLSKIEAGRLALSRMPVAIEPLCQSSLRMMAQTAAERRIAITARIERGMPPVMADERRLKQVLVNLLSNALKFTPEGGSVGLDASHDRAGGELRLAVWDSGIGIAASDLGRLFQPFVQLDSSLSRKYNGTGLGLALVARMVELHDGRVWAESEPGHGSRFIVTIPLTSPALDIAPPTSEEQSAAPTVSIAPKALTPEPLILIADDNLENIQVLQEYIIRHGYHVVTASNGQDAVARAAELSPALILMDIQMPGMDGLEAIAHIRAAPRTADVPIIALTALAMPGDRERCLAAGATDYLSKPVGLRDLMRTLQWHLGTYQEK